MTTPARTRFAPSPTGYLHIGAARTALFAWLYARHTRGQFLLRIEDTDRKRLVPGAQEKIIQGLRWLGLDWDEGPEIGGPHAPYIQSQRLEKYQQAAERLIAEGHAYRCYCTPEELAAMREQQQANKEKIGYDRRCRYLTPEQRAAKEAEGRSWVVRLAVPEQGSVTLNDLIRGPVTFENKALQDAVLLKADGYPTYHLAVVVDDHDMEITHVVRGEEWISSTPLHVHLYNFLGWPMPILAHTPSILKPSGKGKISKRALLTPDGSTIPVMLHEFPELGYLPEALFNFLSGIGWSLDGETEIYDQKTAIKHFDLKDINPGPARFPAEKLEWMNGVYIRNLSIEELVQRLIPYLSRDLGISQETLQKDERLRIIAPAIQERLKILSDATPLIDFLYTDTLDIGEPKLLVPRKTTPEQTVTIIQSIISTLQAIDSWDEATLEQALRNLAKTSGLKAGQVFSPIRQALTGKKVAPPLFATLVAVGQQTSLRRLQTALEKLRHALAS
jgi:glutamyl-tRNA synthetase